MTAFSLNPALDPERLATAFAVSGRVEILDLLAPGQAAALRAHLAARTDWHWVMNAGEKVYEMPRAAAAAMAADQRAGLDERIMQAARDGFQYRYESIRVPDASAGRAAAVSLLTDFVVFMGSAPVLHLLGTVTGAPDLAFADGQATAYGPGDFLTLHDDDVAGKHRRAAYVFGLTPRWRAEWGGLLMFHGADGNIEQAFAPAMGALRVFAVPAPHSVSYVTPAAPESRMAVTGWLRSRRPDDA